MDPNLPLMESQIKGLEIILPRAYKYLRIIHIPKFCDQIPKHREHSGSHKLHEGVRTTTAAVDLSKPRSNFGEKLVVS